MQARAAPFHCPELLLIANVLGATFFCEAPQFGGGTDRLGQAHDECCQKGKLGIERKELPQGSNRPTVGGRRHLADSEFWTFIPTDGSASKPTSGFVRVPNVCQ